MIKEFSFDWREIQFLREAQRGRIRHHIWLAGERQRRITWRVPDREAEGLIPFGGKSRWVNIEGRLKRKADSLMEMAYHLTVHAERDMIEKRDAFITIAKYDQIKGSRYQQYISAH